jgi:O-antigen ligase
MGLIVALSRAPLLGFFIGLIIIYYGWSQNKAAIMSIAVLAAAVILMAAIPKFIEYASVTRATAETADQRNVAYRKEMWEAYTEVVLERPYLGWGRFSVPAVKGMKSIDSEYLGVALSSGLPALGFYLVFLFGILIRLMRFAGRGAHDDPDIRLAWCLIAGWVSAIFSQATVYSGAQTVQYLYMLGAVGQVLILSSRTHLVSPETKIQSLEFAERPFNFIRVL